MSKLIILAFCSLSLALSGASFAKETKETKETKESKEPNDKAFEHADDHASFKKGKHKGDDEQDMEVKGKKDKEGKKEKKAKKEKKGKKSK